MGNFDEHAWGFSTSVISVQGLLSGGAAVAEHQEPDRYVLAPEVEAARLNSLRQLGVLETPEERFAHITRMARVALGVPMAAVNLVDRDRQWCKQFSADRELDVNVPRGESVCRATVALAYRDRGDKALIFEDLTDSEFAELPAVTAAGCCCSSPLYHQPPRPARLHQGRRHVS